MTPPPPILAVPVNPDAATVVWQLHVDDCECDRPHRGVEDAQACHVRLHTPVPFRVAEGA